MKRKRERGKGIRTSLTNPRVSTTFTPSCHFLPLVDDRLPSDTHIEQKQTTTTEAAAAAAVAVVTTTISRIQIDDGDGDNDPDQIIFTCCHSDIHDDVDIDDESLFRRRCTVVSRLCWTT